MPHQMPSRYALRCYGVIAKSLCTNRMPYSREKNAIYTSGRGGAICKTHVVGLNAPKLDELPTPSSIKASQSKTRMCNTHTFSPFCPGHIQGGAHPLHAAASTKPRSEICSHITNKIVTWRGILANMAVSQVAPLGRVRANGRLGSDARTCRHRRLQRISESRMLA